MRTEVCRKGDKRGPGVEEEVMKEREMDLASRTQNVHGNVTFRLEIQNQIDSSLGVCFLGHSSSQIASYQA